MDDVWAEGEAYQRYIGRWSRLVAADFLDWLDAGTDQRWLDVGCGAGALTAQIAERMQPRSVLGVDRSQPFVEWAATHVVDPRVSFAVADATQLPADVADVVVSGLVLNFIPDAQAAVASMRAAAPRGTIAAYVWDYAERMEIMRVLWDAAVQLDPAAAALAERGRFPMCEPNTLEAMWRQAGLVEVSSVAIDVPTVFTDFDDYWNPFLGGQGPAPTYVMSLSDDRRTELRERVRDALPTRPDGSIALAVRAWAVRGRSPS
ncbi:MAG: putative methyltransferase,S-adenosyl-L-methionine (SAM)-MTase protein [Ilumatobacteraceae bacterium]|nr:putative methyltransferase,S-adenosyl-L-methionine (SAM)-MTase protein [Ilumatobacteraceae bacterium]